MANRKWTNGQNNDLQNTTQKTKNQDGLINVRLSPSVTNKVWVRIWTNVIKIRSPHLSPFLFLYRCDEENRDQMGIFNYCNYIAFKHQLSRMFKQFVHVVLLFTYDYPQFHVWTECNIFAM
jgi:uncharacterized protein with von Willebrand factor type A (vWA) domain